MPRVGHIDQHGEWIYMYDATRPRHNEIDDILNRKFDFAFYWDSDNLNNESLEPRAIVPCSKLKSYLKTWRLKEDIGGLEIEYAFDKYFKDQFVEDLKDGIDVNVPEKQEKRGLFSADLLSKNNKKQTSVPKPESTKVETVKTDEEGKRLLNEIKNGINKLAGTVQSTGSRNSIRVENK